MTVDLRGRVLAFLQASGPATRKTIATALSIRGTSPELDDTLRALVFARKIRKHPPDAAWRTLYEVEP